MSLALLRPSFEKAALDHPDLCAYMFRGPHPASAGETKEERLKLVADETALHNAVHRHAQIALDPLRIKSDVSAIAVTTTEGIRWSFWICGDYEGARIFNALAASSAQDLVQKRHPRARNWSFGILYSCEGASSYWLRMLFEMGWENAVAGLEDVKSIIKAERITGGDLPEGVLFSAMPLNPFLASAAAIEFLCAEEGTENSREIVEWSDPKPPQAWAKLYKCSWKTLSKQIKSGTIKAQRLSQKSYRIARGDAPEVSRQSGKKSP